MSNPFVKLILPQIVHFLAQRYDEYRRKQRERQWREKAQRCEQEQPITVIEKSSARQAFFWATLSLIIGTVIGLGLSQINEVQTQLRETRQKLQV